MEPLPPLPEWKDLARELENKGIRTENALLKREVIGLGILSIVLFSLLMMSMVAYFSKEVNVNFEPEMIRYTPGPIVQNNIQASHVMFDVNPWLALADDLGYDWGDLYGNSMQPTFFEGNMVLEKRYAGEELKTGQLVRYYRLNETENCSSIAEKNLQDTKEIVLRLDDITIFPAKDNQPPGYSITYTKNMSSCVMLYRYEGNNFWLASGYSLCANGGATATIYNIKDVIPGAKYRLCRPSGGICSNLAYAGSPAPAQTGGSWTGNEMAVIHRIAAVYDDLIVMQGDNLMEEENIQRCQITHLVVGILYT